jgi:predicted RNA binding protein YcfA (HicA-like mRNA interferase family)
MRVQELVRHLEDDGWREVKRTGDARLLTHGQRPGLLTILGSDRLEVPLGTLRAVFTTPSARGPREILK